MGTTEFMIAGLLPEMVGDLHVSVARAGLLITAFAVGMIIGSPSMAALTLHLPRRATLVAALLVFAAGHVVVALSASFTIVLAARVLTALATGAFWSVAAVVATAATGPEARSRALGVVIGGLTLANVIGVPLGSFAGELAGWRGPFWVLAAVATTAAAVIGRFVPTSTDEAAPSLRRELSALRQGRLWLALAAAATVMGGVLAAYTYISPQLTERTGVPTALIPLVLAGFGAGALAGTLTGGRLGDRYPIPTTLIAAAAAAVALALLAVSAGHLVPTIALIVLMGLFGFAVNPVVSALAVQFAGSAPTMAAALSTSAFNVGIAAGSALAGLTLSTGLGLAGPPAVGAAITALTVVPLLVLRSRTRRNDRNQRAGLDSVKRDDSAPARSLEPVG